MKKKNQKIKMDVVLELISVLLIIIFLASFIFFSYFTLKLNIIPFRYIILGLIGVLVMFITSCFCMFGNTSKIIKTIAMIILFLFSMFLCFANRYLSSTYDFFNK